MRGKGMNITLKKVIWNEIRIRGEKEVFLLRNLKTYFKLKKKK